MEIRRLFALLDGGNKRAVEPTNAMRALETEYGSALVGHQNVSHFHLLTVIFPFRTRPK